MVAKRGGRQHRQARRAAVVYMRWHYCTGIYTYSVSSTSTHSQALFCQHVHIRGYYMDFLEIQRRHWQTAAEKSVLASVRALYYIHKVRFGGSPGGHLTDLSLCNRDSSGEDDGNLDDLEAQTARKRKPVAAPVLCGSDPSSQIVLPRGRKLRHTLLESCQRHRVPSLQMPCKAQCLTTGGGARRARSLSRRCQAKRRHYHGSQRDTTGPGAVGMPSGAPAESEMNHHPDSPRLSRRKRKAHDDPNIIYDTDDPRLRVEGNLNNLDMSLETNSTCCGIAGGSWLTGNDDGPEELHGGAQCRFKSERGARADARQECVDG